MRLKLKHPSSRVHPDTWGKLFDNQAKTQSLNTPNDVKPSAPVSNDLNRWRSPVYIPKRESTKRGGGRRWLEGHSHTTFTQETGAHPHQASSVVSCVYARWSDRGSVSKSTNCFLLLNFAGPDCQDKTCIHQPRIELGCLGKMQSMCDAVGWQQVAKTHQSRGIQCDFAIFFPL